MLPPDNPTLVTWSPTDHCKSLHPRAIVQPIPCFIYSVATPEYDQQFPSLERKMDPITGKTSKPFVHPSEVQPNGKLKPLTQAEEVLNWQSKNMVSQNEILQNLDKKVDKITEKIDEINEYLKVLSQKMQKHYRSLKAQVSQLDRDLRTMLEERTFGKTFDQKEREIRNIQVQVKEIDDFLRASHERKPKPVENNFFDPSAFPTYFKQPERFSPFYPAYVSSPPDQVRYILTTYRPKSTRTATPSTSKTKGKASCLSASSSDSQDILETPSPKIQKEEETPDKESEGNYIPRPFMENIKEEESFFEEESSEETLIPERTKSNGGPWFTFDDIPPSRWRKRLLEFGAWLDTQMMKTSADSYKIIEEF
ncbi:hypothetical protein KIW84_051738 [Lathyrus oleraceus]|uniref:Uncharacterized protein n=1 Tax=Pisum sativum TaxID=3888 RepID=A0A9D4WMW0_PEA|nr:hypothetical protein KIW84_051738 [Pisum sativum]